MYISHRYPKAALHGLGFSLGSNVMTRYLAEEGDQARLHSACALACVSKPIPVFQTCFRNPDIRTAMGLGEKQRQASDYP